jgi:toxin ParE1/3/4
MWTLAVSSIAELDTAKAALWYEEQRAGLGLELISEIELVFSKLKRDPELFRVHYANGQSQVRRVLTNRFPCHIYYYLEGQVVRVFAVVHASRHEHEWKGRL